MKLTKYSHACIVLEKDGSSLVIDPGGWSKDLVVPDDVAGVVLTHEHSDHWDEELLSKLTEKNPDAVVYAHPDVSEKLTNYPTQSVNSGDTIDIGPFAVSFYGGEHAIIHSSMPQIANLGVMVDNTMYYPGDSFAKPTVDVTVLAVPAGAPWMKMSEAMDYLAELAPKRAFPTHDAILSEGGKGLSDMLLGSVANDIGTRYERIPHGSSIDI